MSKKIVIYGASSLISFELIKILYNEIDNFFLFCRNKSKINNFIENNHYNKSRFTIFETNLLNVNDNFEFVNKLNKIDGLIWVAGDTGNSEEELKDFNICKNNLKINLLNPILIINEIIKKMEKNNKSYIAVVASVAGLRGRGVNLIYGSAKAGLIAYLSGLRQKYNKKIKIITIIPGYIKTNKFKINVLKFLVTQPSVLAKKIVRGIKLNQNIVYCSFVWRIIMFIIKIIPEAIFKKLKF